MTATMASCTTKPSWACCLSLINEIQIKISSGADTKILAKGDNNLLHMLLGREAQCWDPRPTARMLIAAGIHPKVKFIHDMVEFF